MGAEAACGEIIRRNLVNASGLREDERTDFFAKQRIFLGGNWAGRDPGRRGGGVMRNPNYTFADTM